MIKKCVIPIAGKGTRFLPITKVISKEMLPILNVPTIYLQVKEAYLSGIREIIFVVNKNNYELIKKFFTLDYELNEFLENDNKLDFILELNEIITNTKFHCVFQDENLRGSAGAVYAAKDYLDENEFFGVIFGDDLIISNKPPLKELMEISLKYNSQVVGINEVGEDKLLVTSMCKYDSENNLEDFIPYNKDFSYKETLCGRLIVNKNVLENIDNIKKDHKREGALHRLMMTSCDKIKVCKINGSYFDIGSVKGYLNANIEFGKKEGLL